MRKLQQDDLVLCSGTVRRLDLPDTAAVAAGAGYQGISVYLHEVRAARREGWTLASLRRMLDDLGLAVAEVDGQVAWLPGEPTSERFASVDEARALQQRLLPLARSIGPIHGVPGLKAALDLAGFTGGTPRPPLRPVSAAVVESLRAQLSELGLLREAHAAGR